MCSPTLPRVKERTSELQAAKDAVDRANEMKSQFLANMSHDLRTPLNGILGYAQILKRHSEITPRQREGLQIIHQCGDHLGTLINDILDFSKAEANKLEIEPHNFHLENLILNVQDICRVQTEPKGIELHLQVLNLTAPIYLSRFLILLSRSCAQFPRLPGVSETPISSFVLVRGLCQKRVTLFDINAPPILFAPERGVLKTEVEEILRLR
jgi:signal transduction histidine kinase